MAVFTGIINVLLVLNAIILIVSVLMQEGSRQGLGVIAGGAETFFGKSKGRSYEGKLEWITKIGVTTFIIFAILMTAMNARQGISNVAPLDLTNAPKVSDILDQKKQLQGDGQPTDLPVEETAVTEEAAPTETTATEDAATESSASEAAVAPEATTVPVAEEAPAAETVPASEEPVTEAEAEPAA